MVGAGAVRKQVEGQALLVTLVVFTAISIIMIGLVSMCFMVRQSAAYDCRCLQAWQAADAGVEVARYKLICCCRAGEDWPRELQVQLGDEARAEVAIEYWGEETDGAFVIVSTGYYYGAVRQVQARMHIPAEQEE